MAVAPTVPGFAPGETDPPGAAVETIPTSACYDLLRTKEVGRLVVVVADEADVFPVNYLVDGSSIVFRTAYGLKFIHSILRRITFEVDDLDEVRREGWSVVVKGVGEEASDPLPGSATAGDDRLATWVDGDRERWVRVVPRVVTGRRLVHAPSSIPGSDAVTA